MGYSAPDYPTCQLLREQPLGTILLAVYPYFTWIKTASNEWTEMTLEDCIGDIDLVALLERMSITQFWKGEERWCLY